MLTDTEVQQHLAANIRRILTDRGLDQMDLAARTGDAPMTISRICNGRNCPRIGVLSRIAEALDVSLDRLVAAPAEKSLRSA